MAASEEKDPEAVWKVLSDAMHRLLEVEECQFRQMLEHTSHLIEKFPQVR